MMAGTAALVDRVPTRERYARRKGEARKLRPTTRQQLR
jgi:hypothetical protein